MKSWFQNKFQLNKLKNNEIHSTLNTNNHYIRSNNEITRNPNKMELLFLKYISSSELGLSVLKNLHDLDLENDLKMCDKYDDIESTIIFKFLNQASHRLNSLFTIENEDEQTSLQELLMDQFSANLILNLLNWIQQLCYSTIRVRVINANYLLSILLTFIGDLGPLKLSTEIENLEQITHIKKKIGKWCLYMCQYKSSLKQLYTSGKLLLLIDHFQHVEIYQDVLLQLSHTSKSCNQVFIQQLIIIKD